MCAGFEYQRHQTNVSEQKIDRQIKINKMPIMNKTFIYTKSYNKQTFATLMMFVIWKCESTFKGNNMPSGAHCMCVR